MRNQAGGHHRRGPRHSDVGLTFIEIVVAVALMGVVVIPVLAAVRASLEASSRARSAAQVETMVVNAADRVNRAPKACDYSDYARAAVRSQQWDPSTVTEVAQAYYEPGVDLDADGHWVWGDSACRLDEPSPLEVQTVRITITSPDGRISRTIEVVKSDV